MLTKLAGPFGLFLTVLILPLTLKGATLGSYDFTGNPGTAPTTSSSVLSGLTFSNMTFGPGLTPLASVNSMTASGFSTGGAAGTLNIANNDYWEFTVTPDSGYKFSVETITFSYLRATNGAQNLTFRSSLDNYASDITTPQTGIPGAATQNLSFSLSSLIDQEGPLTIRLYGYGATTAGSTGALRSNQLFNVIGAVETTAIPEPSSMALIFGSAVLVSTVVKRRRHSAAVGSGE